ncbi:MAG: hypothetical protein ACRC10_05530 [Thermoguttaceae bacterium]
MRIAEFSIKKSKIPGYLTIVWASAGLEWVYLDGRFVAGPIDSGTVDLAIPSGSHAIEIVTGEEYQPSDSVPLVRPNICWLPVDNATQYRIVVNGKIVQTITGQSDSYEYACPIRLTSNGGDWHSIRVDAVTDRGIVNVPTVILNYWAIDIPVPPSVTFTNKDGLVQLTITK